MLSADQVPAQIKYIFHGGMCTNESLSLPHRLESSHALLPHPGRLMGLLCLIILVLFSTVDRLWNQFPVSEAMASQFIGDALPGFFPVTSQ